MSQQDDVGQRSCAAEDSGGGSKLAGKTVQQAEPGVSAHVQVADGASSSAASMQPRNTSLLLRHPDGTCSTASDRRAAVEALGYVKKNLRHNDEFFGLFGMTLDMGIVTRIVGLGITLLVSLGSLLGSYVYSKFTRT